MKKKFTARMILLINLPLMALLLALIITFATLASTYRETISRFLFGVGDKISEQTAAEGKALVNEIVDEGIVLLKNDNDTLPVKDLEKVNVFGWAAYDWLTGGFGSSFSNTEMEKLKLFPALERAGIEYNKTLAEMYEEYYSKPAGEYGGPWDEYRGDVSVSGNNKFTLHEPGAGYYTNDIINEAKAFSDVALVVIGRVGGEGKDLRKYQEKQNQDKQSGSKIKDESRHYLELSTEEEEMIAAAKAACDKVIVVLNTASTMELGFVDDEGIDACLLVGLTGLNGVESVIDVIKGDVTPSGRTVDTYAYDLERTPSFATSGYGDGNSGALKYVESTVSYGSKGYYDAYVDYSDGIYVGYRYYETVAYSLPSLADKPEQREKVYDAFVQYPFGYGLSYTDFEWTVKEISVEEGESLSADDTITIKVDVKNVGTEYSGKDVVQVYYNAPYYEGEVEKSYVNLVAFAKTGEIAPGEYETLTLEFDVRDMASYDCYDSNDNGNAGYELDAGDYNIMLMRNSHDLQTDFGVGSVTDAVIEYRVDEDILYKTDEVTGNEIVNRFTGENAAEGIPIDGSEETVPVTYLSRANNMVATLPKVQPRRSRSAEAYSVAKAQAPTDEQLEAIGLDNAEMPETGASGEMKFIVPDPDDPEKIIADSPYSILNISEDDPEYAAKWNDLISQITKTELFELLRDGYFKTEKLESINKPEYTDLDGISGLNTRIFSSSKCSYIMYPNETLIAQTWNVHLGYQMGLSVGREANDAGIDGWYAPGGNIHRSPCGGRNFEYFSEDPLLAGKFTAEVVRGAKDMGLYAYIKHFAINESETMREGLFTWLTEQSLREIYLKPFEIAVKEGGANALMTSMNRIGATWIGASRALCTDIVRTEWGFDGSMVTDWLDSGTDYMPVFKGIYAGNSIWLNNAENNRIFSDSAYEDNAAFVILAQRVARDVIYTYVDTERARAEYLAESGISGGDTTIQAGSGTEYNYSWVGWVIAIEAVLVIGLGVWIFFVARALIRNKRKDEAADAGVAK